MSSFMNGSGGLSSSDAASALSKWQGAQTGDQSGLTGALQAGQGGTAGGDTYAFKLPTAVANAIGSDATTSPTAGLTGVQSGMTMPDFSNAMTGSGDYGTNFTMPTGSSGGGLSGMAAAGAKLQSGLKDLNSQQPTRSGGGVVRLTPRTFGAPVVALPMAQGSQAGQSLLSMMQGYQPGVTPSRLTGTMPGSMGGL